MQSSTNIRRRRFVLGAATLVGAGSVAGFTRWIPGRATAGDAAHAIGAVTIVAFDDHGKRLGKRTLARVVKIPAAWKAELAPAQYDILRKGATERPFSGKYVDKPAAPGFYRCVGCGNALYDAATQFHSGTGWPSFWQPIAATNVSEHVDHLLIVPRTEIRCTLCDGHLGHKFHDGPPPTGLRYCMDSRALHFVATAVA